MADRNECEAPAHFVRSDVGDGEAIPAFARRRSDTVTGPSVSGGLTMAEERA